MEVLRQALREAQPQLVQAVHKYALAGFDIPAISRQTQLGLDVVRDLVADSLPEVMCKKLSTEYQEFAELLPANGSWTYNHVLTARSSARTLSQSRQIDTVQTARATLVNRIGELAKSPSLSMRDTVQALKVLGVPQADNTQPATSSVDNAAPAQYVYDEAGSLVDNPAFAAWRSRNAVSDSGQGTVINIGADVLKALEAKADKTLIADSDGQVVGMHGKHGLVPLQSMSVEGLREEVYGETSKADVPELTDVDTEVAALVSGI